MTNCQTSNSNNTANRGYIFDTIVRIDQMQKSANVNTACEGCEGSLVSSFFNTKPVTFYLRGGNKFEVTIPDTNLTTTFFRIENVKNDSVILRLLEIENHCSSFICTNFTVVLTIDCICAIQCFQPICCPECTKCPTI